MINNLATILKEIDENLKVNYNEIFLRRDLTDIEILGLLIHCYKNNISEITETLDINYDKITKPYFSDSEVISFFENIFEIDEDYEDEILNKYSKIVLEEAIKNTRINFSFMDIRQEGLIAMIKFKEEFREKLSTTYDESALEYFVRNFVKRYMLIYQKKEIDNLKEIELSNLLYTKIKSEVGNGKKIDEVIDSLGISKEYYDSLEKMIGNNYNNLSYEEIVENTNMIKEKYDIAIKTSKLNYLEEDKLIREIHNVDKKMDLEIKKIIFKLSIRFDFSIMNDLYKMAKELEIIDEKLN